MTKTICQFCGWEIKKPELYNKNYDEKGSYTCDDCFMDIAIERAREEWRVING